MTSWGRAEIAVRLLDECPEDCSYTVSDVIEAAEAFREFARAKSHLEQECPICTEKYPRNQVCLLWC